MKQYRKKPVTIEAVQFDGLNPTEIKDFVGENCEVEIYDNEVTPPVARIVIHTLEGDMEVSKGDYVIKGVKGEFYPCKPDIFQQTYESEEPDKSLEEAAEDIYKTPFGTRAEDFIAGAEWQASQMPMPEDTVLFNKGVEEGKRLMMEDAVEGEICGRVYDHINVRFADGVCKYLEPKNISHIPADVSKYNIGDKVRILVLKAEEE